MRFVNVLTHCTISPFVFIQLIIFYLLSKRPKGRGIRPEEIKLHLHCAFRGRFGYKKDNCCNMFKNKLGIDCEGNVYTCPWCGYIEVPNADNPFYLGNLLVKPLKDIISDTSTSNRYKDATSTLRQLKLWIQAFKFRACIISSKLPIDTIIM